MVGETNEHPLNENGVSTESSEETILQIKVNSPGGDIVNLSVNASELVQEIHRVLIDREETCHRTCFSLQYEGQTLDLFSELKTVENLKDQVEFRVIEDKYSQREVKTHVKHIYDLMHGIDLRDSYLGRELLSLSFLSSVVEGDSIDSPKGDKNNFVPPEFLIPSLSSSYADISVPLTPLHLIKKDFKPIPCIKQLSYSNWNPPHTQRKLSGDLIYIFVHTLEEKRIHITASPRGFFINQSSEEVFNHKPLPGYGVFHSLVDLLKRFSPSFKKNFEAILKKRSVKNPLERAPAPYQKFSWLSPILPHEADAIRKEESLSSRLASDENLPGQPRDWNEELQMSRELPKSSISERLLRDRSIFKTNSDFTMAATKAAISVVNGDIIAINPGEHRKQQMYIWNNMFFSYGFDIKDHYKDFGGEAAAHVATSSDLNGIRAYSLFDQAGLHTLGTAIIDYKGYRITAQTIIPGILEKEQEKLVIYGSIDFGKTIVSHSRYEELLDKTAKHLKIKPHEVINEKGNLIKLYSSVDCKGIVGNDNRVYILDLLRTFPPDANYLGSQEEHCRPQLTQPLKDLGYPHNHPHLLSTLRQELVEAFAEIKYESYIKTALKELTEEQGQKSSNDETSEELNKDTNILQQLLQNGNLIRELQNLETASEETKKVSCLAAKAVGSLKNDCCEFLFNPDVFHPFVKFPAEQNEEIKRDEQLVVSVCEFLVCHQIPRFIEDISNHITTPQDGQSLVDSMHQRGINVRYLNRIVSGLENTESLGYVKRIAISEIFVRAAKHFFRQYIQDVDHMLISAAVVHFLNCLFVNISTHLNPYASVDDYVIKMTSQAANPSKNYKKSKKKAGNHKIRHDGSNDELAWSIETPASIWNAISQDCADYFHFPLSNIFIDYFIYNIPQNFHRSNFHFIHFCEDFPSKKLKRRNSFDQLIQAYHIPRMPLLRSLCQVTGIQLALKDYQLHHNSKAIFQLEDVVNLLPVVKHLHPIATDAYHYYTTGQTRIAAGHLQEGLALITEASDLLSAVYGPLHPDTGACNRLLARLYYILGEHQTAMIYQQRSTIIAERVHGVDSPSTANEYLFFAIYSFACGHLSAALNTLYRARHICLVCHGEEHPQIAQIDTNIGLLLLVVEEFDLSAIYLENAQRLSRIFYGMNSLKEAFNCHLVSRAHVYRGNYRKALEFEKLRHAIYRDRLGPDSDYTKDSDECTKLLLSQAVSQARKAQQLQKPLEDRSGLSMQDNAVGNVITTKNTRKERTNNNLPKISNGELEKASPDDMAKYLSQRLANVSFSIDTLSNTTSSPFVMSGGARSMFQFPNLPTILETINRVNGIFVVQFDSKVTDEKPNTDDLTVD